MGIEHHEPFILSQRAPVARDGSDPFGEPGVHFDAVLEIWIDQNGSPLWAARSSKPYTSASTAGHMIKGGYTPSGGYKPAKNMPAKMDKRAGK